MRPLTALLTAITVVVSCGCDSAQQRGPRLAITQPVILEPEKADFGFVGRWRLAQDPVWSDPGRPDSDEAKGPPIMIRQADDGAYSVVETAERGDDLEITCRAVSLSDPGFVLVEAEPRISKETRDLHGLPDGLRFLVVAKREGDHLFFQHLYSGDLDTWMAAEGYVVEISAPGIGGGIVSAEASELLDCLKKHWSELCDEPTTHWIREKR